MNSERWTSAKFFYPHGTGSEGKYGTFIFAHLRRRRRRSARGSQPGQRHTERWTCQAMVFLVNGKLREMHRMDQGSPKGPLYASVDLILPPDAIFDRV